jgi:hypothetical protein
MLLLVVDGALVAAGVPDWGWGARLALGLSSLVGVVTAVVAGCMAVWAIVKGERSIVVLGPLLFGALCLVFLLGELLSSH